MAKSKSNASSYGDEVLESLFGIGVCILAIKGLVSLFQRDEPTVEGRQLSHMEREVNRLYAEDRGL